MDTMLNVWTVVEQVRVASGVAELAIFTAVLYWFFTSSCVADMLEVVGERVGGWCGRDSSGSLRQAARVRRRHNQDMYAKLDADVSVRSSALYRLKEEVSVPAPQPPVRPSVGLACARCAPVSRESWQDPAEPDNGAVINVTDIGRQKYANGGVVSRYFCDLVHSVNLKHYFYKDVVTSVTKDESFKKVLEEVAQKELEDKMSELGAGEGGVESQRDEVRKRIEARAHSILRSLGSAMSNTVLKMVAWFTQKAMCRVSAGGCGSRGAGAARLRRAAAAGLPLVFVPLHRSHLDYILLTFTLYLSGLRPPLVAAGDNLRIPFFGWVLRGCGAFYIRRRNEGSSSTDDPVYKAALRSYIQHSLEENNNLEFFIEGGRTRTGKPQLPKAGILSVILDAYMDGTIEDAFLVPATVNYDKLVDGNYVREQLGMPKQMETFWSALRGIWRTLNTNHGSIRVDFNQPISLKELVTSFQKYNYLKAPLERPLTPPNNNLTVNLDKKILYNHSHSSLYGDEVSADYKIMVEAIGRHLVYDAAQATAVMSTNVVSYVLVTEVRGTCALPELRERVQHRGERVARAGRELGYCGDLRAVVHHAMELLGRGLVVCEGGAVRARPTVAAALELAYYANTLVAHYAPQAILATALESLLCENEQSTVVGAELSARALRLCALLSHEFVLSAPCTPVPDLVENTLNQLVEEEILHNVQNNKGLEEQQWSRRFAQTLEDDEDRPDPAMYIKYKVSKEPEAVHERRRLVLSLRPLLESYAATCRCLRALCRDGPDAPDGPDNSQRTLVKTVLDTLAEEYAQNRMPYGAALSTDAINNCLRLLKQWGVIEMYVDDKVRKIRICEGYSGLAAFDDVCQNIYKFNMDTPLLKV